MEKYSNLKNSKNPRVIAMLSGGKDSIASIVLLKKNGIDVTAIHFVHDWSSEIPTEEAKRICKDYEIPLEIINYTKEFCDAINGYRAGRPCLLCKKQMYKILLGFLKDDQYGWICIGDNSNDKTTIARIKQFIQNGHKEDTLICNGYFGSEMGIKLPEGMKVIRPLIEMSSKAIEGFLNAEGIYIKRINSTGDKYFEYHREGCPIQFADVGVELNENLYGDLKKYNDCITNYARENNILASIHMPSTFIITIPKGYENTAADYLEKNGLPVNKDVNSSEIPSENKIFGYVFDLKMELFETKAYEKIFNRFLERLELYGLNKSIRVLNNTVLCSYRENNVSLDMAMYFDEGEVDIKYLYNHDSDGRKDKTFFDNLILETFRTRKYKVIVIVD